MVNFVDYTTLVLNYLTASGMQFTDADFNGDGAVTFGDYSLLLANYGVSLTGGLGLPGDIATAGGPGGGDWRVDDYDLALIHTNWQQTTPDGDISGDGYVDIDDLDFVMAQFGLELSVLA